VKSIALAVQSLLTGASQHEIVFTRIHRGGGWGCTESVSGAGSTLVHTENIRTRLPELLNGFSIKTLLDIPCGDFNWMKEVNLGSTRYIGGDIVRELVERNRRSYASPQRMFLHLDILTSFLPAADAILCRDCLPHLPTSDKRRALHNMQRSGAGYLLTSHYTSCTVNEDIPMGKFQRVNFERAPFCFPPPLVVLEDSDGRYADKTLALWRIVDLPPMS